MEEVNDRERTADERHCQDCNKGEKERGLGQKIPSRLVTEVFTADVEEGTGWTASGSAMITIQRERLKITVGRGEFCPLPASKISASPIRAMLGARFHRLPTFLLSDAAGLKLGFNIPPKIRFRKRYGQLLRRVVGL
jgi:hypothetical protein